MKQAKSERRKGMLVKGKAAAKPKNMEYNKKVMERAGYSPRRAAATAYGEVGMEKMARRHESEGMKRAMKEKKEMEKKKAEHAKHKERHSHHMKKASEMLKKADEHMKKAKTHHKGMKSTAAKKKR